MADVWESRGNSIDSPIEHAATVTPNDSADLAVASRVLLLSDAGTVVVDMVGGETSVALPLQAGWNPARVTRVYATGTDAVTIVAGW